MPEKTGCWRCQAEGLGLGSGLCRVFGPRCQPLRMGWGSQLLCCPLARTPLIRGEGIEA